MIAAKNLSKIGRPGEDFTGRIYGTMEVLWRAREREAARKDRSILWLCRCQVCGAERVCTSSSLRKGISPCPCQKPKKPEVRSGPACQTTLCWDCQRAAGPRMCPWALDGKPIAGWSAQPTLIKLGGRKGGISHSYRVTACPLYEKDLPRKTLGQRARAKLGLEAEA